MNPALADILQNRRRLTTVLLIACLLLTIGARLADIASKKTIRHDEAISYLAASCRQASIGGQEITVYPVPAAEWKDYYRVERPFCFAEISRGLAISDVHPPLYFWLLHVWILLVGTHLWTGPLLNLIIALVTIVALFYMSSSLLGDRSEALLVVFTFALIPAIVHISAEARQYGLLSLWALLFIWQILRVTNRQIGVRLSDLLLLTLISLVGALTHYHFIVAASGGAIYATLRLVRRDRKRLITILLAIGIGYLIAAYLFPIAPTALGNAQKFQSAFNSGQLKVRLERTGMALREFNYLWIGMVFTVLALIGAAFASLARNRRINIQEYVRQTNFSGFESLFFLFWIGSMILLLYFTFLSPRHAMGVKYFSMALPFLSFLPVIFLRLLCRPWSLTLYFYLVPILLIALAAYRGFDQPTFEPNDRFVSADVTLIDIQARGILPQVIWHMRDDQLVIVGNQDFVLSEFDNLVGYLTENSVYVSDLSYGNTQEKQSEILKLLSQEGFAVQKSGSVPIRSGLAARSAPIYSLK